MDAIDIEGRVEGHPTAAMLAAPLGPHQTNCYVYSPNGSDGGVPCWIIDPGYQPAGVIGAIREHDWTVEAVLLTHAHADHILGLAEVLEAFPDTPVLIHEAEEDWPADPAKNLSQGMGVPFAAPEPTRTFAHGDTLAIGHGAREQRWEVRHVPGHSPGGCAFVAPGGRLAVVGDALFAGSIGRTDFPGSDFDTLASAIREQLYTLASDCLALPGHGPPTTIGAERESNPFVRRG
ncbi:MAG: MBL fold metallo-hydrolase [Planctomycetota bacterium]